MQTLSDIWKEIDSCASCRKEGNELQHILGSGKTKNPRIMVVFINPTSRNISSNENWKGSRFPFIGRKSPWNIFQKIGWIDKKLFDEIKTNESKWSYEFTEKVNAYLSKKGLYLTNIVKCTGKDATLPSASKIKSQSELFEREIELVDPEIIVSFGLLPTKALLKKDVKMSRFYQDVMSSKSTFHETKIGKKTFKVFPCYYPIGRGNPKQAMEMLTHLNSYLLNHGV